MLNVRERLAIQKSVNSGLNQLNTGIRDIRERLKVQKEVNSGLARLNGESPAQHTLLDRFLSLEFTNETPNKFYQLLRRLWPEIVEKSIDLVRKPLLAFLKAHQSDMVLESVSLSTYDLNSPERLRQIVQAIYGNSATDTVLLKFN